METTLIALDFPWSQPSQPKQMHNFNLKLCAGSKAHSNVCAYVCIVVIIYWKQPPDWKQPYKQNIHHIV